jgi:hypothetical protein
VLEEREAHVLLLIVLLVIEDQIQYLAQLHLQVVDQDSKDLAVILQDLEVQAVEQVDIILAQLI